MSLEKCVCITYICVAIVLGGFSAYFVVTFTETKGNSITQDENKSSSNESDDKKEKVVAAASTYKKYGQVVNSSSSLCISDEPNLDSNISYYLYEGMTFDILDKNNGWYKIKYKDITGYVKDEYIEEYDENPPNPIYNGVKNDLITKNIIPIPIKVELTAYCNCPICSEAWGSQTAMQTHTQIGVIAAPNVISLGSKIYIPELKQYKDDGMFSVEDRGGAVVVKNDGTYIIDVWLPTHEEVKAFGRKKTLAFLLTE